MSDSVPEPDPPDREGADFVPEPGSSLDLEPPAPAPLLGAPGTTAELLNPLSLWIVDPDDAPALDPEDGAAVCPGPPLEAEPPEPAPPDPKAPPAPPECGAPSRAGSGTWSRPGSRRSGRCRFPGRAPQPGRRRRRAGTSRR